MLAPYGGLISFSRKDHPSAMRLDDELRILRGLSIAFPAVFLSIAAFMSSAVLTPVGASPARADRATQSVRLFLGAGRTALLQFAIVIVVLGTVVGGISGFWLGTNVVDIYHRFFRFPHLTFHLDVGAFGVGASRQHRRRHARRARGGAAGGASPARRSDAAGAAGEVQRVVARTDRASTSSSAPRSAWRCAISSAGRGRRSSLRSASRSPRASRSFPARCATASITFSISNGIRRRGRMSPWR